MKWSETLASTIRWAEAVNDILHFDTMEIVWEEGEQGYSGYANVVAYKDGVVYHYEWSYGSCSGCDAWEDNEHKIEYEVNKTVSKLYKDTYEAYFKHRPEVIELLKPYFQEAQPLQSRFERLS
jgi:hypothetical protein